MGSASNLFFNSDPNSQTLHKRIIPSDEQIKHLRDRWHSVSDYVSEYVETVSGYPARSWIQGSYKFGTLIRPISINEEYDVDLGIYLIWYEDEEDPPTPKTVKIWTQDSLIEYCENDEDATEVIDPPKERCARIKFSKKLHIDVPSYHLDDEKDERKLATATHGWEESDPKALVLWFRSKLGDPERREIRRVVQYLKAWSALKFSGSEGKRPSSILLTVLATEAFEYVRTDETNGDDELFKAIVSEINMRLKESSIVGNPVNPDENLNRLKDDENEEFMEKLEVLEDVASRAVEADDVDVAALIWSEAFEHLFPLPETLGEAKKALVSKLPARILPNIRVRVTEKKTGSYVATFDNAVPRVSKDCNLLFEIINPESFPDDVEIEWIVRNEGRDAETVNDLGHTSKGIRKYTQEEHTRYRGRQFMDCIIKQNGRIISLRRVPVKIQAITPPKRNPPRPGYVKLRQKRRK